MATIRQALSLQDRMSPVLSSIMKSMRSTMNVMEQMNAAAGRGITSEAWRQARRDIENAEDQLRQFGNEQDDIVQGQERVRKGFSGWQAAIVTVNQGLQLAGQLVDALEKPIQIADSFISTDARLRNINDGLQTQAELQEKIYNSAQRSRGSYTETADAVAKLNLLAGDTFKSNDEAIAFAEIMNKAFTVAGADTSEASAAMRQMTQALASGRLQGDEFTSIRENAPLIAQAIQDYMGVTAAEMKELSSEGAITADIIKNAVFGAGAEIDTLFSNMPYTFEQSMERIKNAGLFAVQPLIYAFSDFVQSDTFEVWSQNAVNAIRWVVSGVQYLIGWASALAATPGFQQFAATAGTALSFVGNALLWIGNLILDVVSWVITNWSTLEPILIGAAILVGGLAAAWGIYNGVLAISKGIQLVMTIGSYALAAARGAEVTATTAATAAQWGLNTALLANPVTWIIIAVIALIAIIIALVLWIIKLWNTNIDFRVGVIRIWNSILNFFDQVPIFFMGIGYGIADAFGWAKVQVLTLMQNMANGVIDIINGVINAINLIPGVAIDPLEHLTFAATAAAEEEAAKQQRADNLQAAKDEAAAKAAEREAQLQVDAAQWRAEAEAQAAEAAAQQEELGVTEDSWTPGAGAEGFGDYSQFEDPGAGGVPTNVTGGKLDSVDEVGISDEDLKYLRDIAQAEYINQYTTQRPVVYANFGDVRETADVNQVIEVLEAAVAGAYDSSLDRG